MVYRLQLIGNCLLSSDVLHSVSDWRKGGSADDHHLHPDLNVDRPPAQRPVSGVQGQEGERRLVTARTLVAMHACRCPSYPHTRRCVLRFSTCKPQTMSQ